MNIIDSYKWRYATKRMTGESIEKEKLQTILEAVRIAPTSMGFQPFKVIVIENKDIREKMKQACFNQPQITESACMLVFAIFKDNFSEKVDEYIELIAETRNRSIESLNETKKMLLHYINNRNFIEWASRQVYIALGFALSTAAILNVDTTPMEGFSPEELDKVLKLDEIGLKSVVIMAIGKRDVANDYLVNLPKVRKDAAKIFINL